jgi:hypothetical protein
MKDRPDGWDVCAKCRHRKVSCRPPVGTEPPYTSCAACLNLGIVCVPVPQKSKRRANKKKSTAAQSKSKAPAGAPVVKGTAGLDYVPSTSPFPSELPPLPVYGSSLVPLADLLAWRSELEDAVREHTAAVVAREAAILRVGRADERRRVAYDNFTHLMGELEAPPGRRDKGKSRASPVSVDDDSDAEGSADDSGGFEEGGDGGAMDVS